MDPITLASITAAVSVLASECAKGAANRAGQEVWASIKEAFGWVKDPNLNELAPKIAQQLITNGEVAAKIIKLLQDNRNKGSKSAVMVNSIEADRVVIAEIINVQKDFRM